MIHKHPVIEYLFSKKTGPRPGPASSEVEHSLRKNLSVGTQVRFSAQDFSDAIFFTKMFDTDLRKNVIALATYNECCC